MKGLLLKDASVIMKETKYFFLLAVVMSLLQNEFLFAYIVVYAATLPMAAIAYDERVKWNRMEETLPLTRAQMIGCKYIMGYISIAAAILLVFCGRLFGAVINLNAGGLPAHSNNLFSMLMASLGAEVWFSLLIICCIALTIQAFNLPLMFWIGVERGRLLFILIIVGAATATVSIWEELGENTIHLNLTLIFLIALAITIVVNLISFQVSKALYNREK